MKIAAFPGSFKPPHIGHLKVVESILKNQKPDKFYIFISNKPRLLVPPFQTKLGDLSKNELDNIGKKFNLKNTSKKGIEEAAKDGMIPSVSALASWYFWETYIKTLPKKMQEKVKIIVSNLPSPIMFAFVVLKGILKKDDSLILLKSKKDEKDTRFSLFDKLGVNIDEVLIPTFKKLNSWEMREAIANKNYNKVKEFMPKKLTKSQKDKLLLLI